MPDFKQRAEDALRHLEEFEQGALADVKAELRKIARPAAAADVPAEPDAPAKPAKQDAGA